MSTVTIRTAPAIALAIAMGVGCSAPPPAQTSTTAAPAGGIDRTVLPIAEPAPPALHRARCAERQAAGAVRGQGARTGTQCRHRADRRRRLRRAEHVRRSHPDADDGSTGAGRPALQQLPHHGAVLADAQCAQDRAQPPHRQHRLDHGELRRRSRATPGRTRTASRRWRRCCGSTATAPARSASGTRRPPGRPACRVRSTAGPRIRASTSSTASSAARPTSGTR